MKFCIYQRAKLSIEVRKNEILFREEVTNAAYHQQINGSHACADPVVV